MKILIVGAGGREHALAWKVAQSPRLSQLYIAPGNAGTDQQTEASKIHNVAIQPDDHAALVTFCHERQIDLAIIGPEVPLASGLADDLRSVGVRVFGPSRAAAQIEASKAFAKAFMARHHLPTARYAPFTDFYEAVGHLLKVKYPVVIKASGLAAGKGVILPDCADEAEAALRQIMLDRDFGAAGDEAIIEERLTGEEVSLLAFTDGFTVCPMPPAQDHKRLLDGDQGPNTGGMGAYAPAPICPPELVATLTRTILQPTVDGLRAEGTPFVGVLYAGLMLTPAGPRVLEFNCRFGDPETQAILPLLDSDIVDIAEACAEGRLAGTPVKWKPGAAACVVLASEGYPGPYPTGREISGLEAATAHALIFHAGTRRAEDKILTSGGRVLCVTGQGGTLREALSQAYAAIHAITFDGMQYRRDIGHRALGSSYTAAGVNIDAGNRAVELMRTAVQSTYGPEVLAGIGAFGGLFDASKLKAMAAPVLVASTDGVGTKVKLAAQAGHYESIGHDLVNHCINDILVQGAHPLFFLDYIASAKLLPDMAAAIVTGIAAACQAAGCALLGGETAEMPGVYAPEEFDVAGTIVGAVERAQILPRADLLPGDQLVGLRSSGPHTNGYSLIRSIFEGVPLDTVYPELGQPLGDMLLAPHRSYLPLLQAELQTPHSRLKALAHLTGGGFIENIPRILPDHLGAVVRPGRWPVPPLFQLIQQRGQVPLEEMYRVFNMGLGMVAVVAPQDVHALQAALGEETWVIGELVSGPRKVMLI
jgi:phosphoribosylamine--glycine ligase/phosphoribosylaminoimidazole synthetase